MNKLWYILIFNYIPVVAQVYTSKEGHNAWIRKKDAKAELLNAKRWVKNKIEKGKLSKKTCVHLARQES